MKFSVLIPSYNCRCYLGRSLGSVLKQTCDNYEVVLCDDGSTDSTKSFINEFLVKNDEFAKKIKLISNEKNEGLIVTRNRLVREAEGDYVVFLDADDEIDENYLLNLSRIIEEKNSDIVEFPMLVVTKNGDFIQKFGDYDFSGEDCLDRFFERNPALRWYLTSKAIRRQVMLGSLPEDMRMALDDIFFTMNVFANAKSYSSRDSESHYIYHYGVGYWSSKDEGTISLERYNNILNVRVNQLNYNFEILEKYRKNGEFCADLYNSCVGGEILMDIFKIEKMSERKQAFHSLLEKFDISILPKK